MLSAQYGGINALREVSLRVAEGQTVALIGANGAGKTTLARTVMGLVPASGGSVCFMGRELGSLPTEQRVSLGLGLVPEGRGLIGNLTVHENLLLGAFTQRERLEERLRELYAMLPLLEPLKDRHARLLSGGELQSLAIGRAIMACPRLLILDEPSMGLSPHAVHGVREVLQQLKAADTSLLLIEQNAELAFSVADYLYVLEVGAVTLEGPPAMLLQNEALLASYLGVA